MLEAGMVRSKNTAEILTKNVTLFAIACTAYLVVGYDIMYGGGLFLSGIETEGAADADAMVAAALAAISTSRKKRSRAATCSPSWFRKWASGVWA